MSNNIRRLLIIFCCIALLTDLVFLALAKKAKRFESVESPIRYSFRAWAKTQNQIDNLLLKIKGKSYQTEIKDDMLRKVKIPSGYQVVLELPTLELVNSLAKELNRKGYSTKTFTQDHHAVIQAGGIFAQKSSANSLVEQIFASNKMRFDVKTYYKTTKVKNYCLMINNLDKSDISWLTRKLKPGSEAIEVIQIP